MRRSLILATALLLSGCGAQEFFFNKDISLTPGHGQMSDIKQRGVFVQSRPDDKGLPTPVVCAEPSPDAMAAVAASMAANMAGKDSTSASLSASVSESAAFVGLRTQTIQLLRDGFYRMCEGYMSGALTAEDYSIMQRRYQANMLALLTIEQLTGASKSPAVTLDTTSLARVSQLHEQLREVQKELAAEDKKTGPDRSDERIKELTARRDRLTTDIETYSSTISQVQVTPNKETIAGVSSAVKEIAMSVIDHDYSGQMCFEYFRRRNDNSDSNATLGEYCSGLLRKNLESMQTSARRTEACLDLVNSLRDRASRTKDSKEAATGLNQAADIFKTCATTGASPPLIMTR
jgi:hypothetical protein